MKKLLLLSMVSLVSASLSAQNSKSVIPIPGTKQAKVSQASLPAVVDSVKLNRVFVLDSEYYQNISKKKLLEANELKDLLQEFPFSWLAEFNELELRIVQEDMEQSEKGARTQLTEAQKNLLAGIKVSERLLITVNFKKQTSGANQPEDVVITKEFIVVPEQPALFELNGEGFNTWMLHLASKNLKSYLSNAMQNTDSKLEVSFIINEAGLVKNVKLLQSSGLEEIDREILLMLHAMPYWQAAKDFKGKKIDQKFILSLSKDFC